MSNIQQIPFEFVDSEYEDIHDELGKLISRFKKANDPRTKLGRDAYNNVMGDLYGARMQLRRLDVLNRESK